MLSKIELMQEFQPEVKASLSVNAMKIAVKALQDHQAQKNRVFQCIVCNNDELRRWLQTIHAKNDQWVNDASIFLTTQTKQPNLTWKYLIS